MCGIEVRSKRQIQNLHRTRYVRLPRLLLGGNVSGVCRRRKTEGRRRASAQLLLPWVDEMPDGYTDDAHAINTQHWVFDGCLMAGRETTNFNAVKAL